MEVAIEHAQGICEYFNVKFERASLDPISKGWLERENKGESVKALQRSLKKLGYSLNVDGSFGPETEKALLKFQKAHHLTVDGLYGPKTQKTMKDAIKRYAFVANKEEEERQMEKNLEETGFKDVEKDSLLQKKITKAKSAGITLGVGNDLFKPNQTVTRAEAVALVVRGVEYATGQVIKVDKE
nr:peptidoglycan-binding protein [Halobacillus kuroshimensis]